jgi:hypothetical protein
MNSQARASPDEESDPTNPALKTPTISIIRGTTWEATELSRNGSFRFVVKKNPDDKDDK